ncbi:hemolysin XhlA family protein [Pectinatus frisingensis]|uniref:hemolysin XhlA family protein n=1 Tax=Pectinatus frisingensis TaxID=865 RepID=UPI0018C54230|nr:hemolysin XhlA family protein [Pectinatus frisingensis]
MENEKEFEKETVSRLSAIETKLDMLVDSCTPCRAKMENINDMSHEALQSAKSAHHRLDDFKTNMRWTIGISITATGILVTVVEHFWR